MIVAAVVILALVIGLSVTAGFWVNWWWFESVGYRSVLVTRYAAQALAFVVGGLLAGAFFAVNWGYALRRGRTGIGVPGRGGASRLLRFPLWVLTGAVFLVAGVAAANRWPIWLLWFRSREFGVSEPIFDRDAGFYVFVVPALAALHRGALALVLATAIVVAVVYAVSFGVSRVNWRRPPRPALTHLLALVGGLLLLVAAGYLLANYGLLFSRRGVVYGPGYTDASVVRWANYALALLSAAAAALLLLNAFVRRLTWLLAAFGAWAVAALVLGAVVPAVVQQTVVEPNELSRERPYIANNIALTRAAFDLERAETRTLSGAGEPDPAALSPETPTFDNIRLWDYRIVRQTFQQLRSFVPYYVFPDVDVDRYEVDGRLRQVLVAARELDVDGLPATAQTWGNEHLSYTHGYGVVVSPVSEATAQGLPRFFVSSIPPEGTGALAIERPELYFGEVPGSWVAVNTRVREVSGIQNETAAEPYAGAARGSIGLGSYVRRLVLALELRDRRVLFSDQLTGDSRVLLRRAIRERAETIAPFLSYDPDPYLVIADGRLVWVIDAYTTTDRFPYATPVEGLSYVRHSAKVTIDAYDGTVTFYRTGAADPIADAYGEIFGDLFRPIAEAPPAVAEHFRYPERLFDLQAEAYENYHVTDPVAFYNGDERWAIAREEAEGATRRETEVRRTEAYYVTLPLPGESEAGFGLVLPFTPNARQNMTAWMAGQTDEAGVPRLVVYRFPLQSNIFGPQQVENAINADPEISTQISLLGDAGSRVILGNLLVIPIGETVLYAQPFYVQATGTAGAQTELQYVILATNERVVMRPTLEAALEALRAGGAAVAPPAAPERGVAGTAPATGAEASALAEQALAAYERAEAALAAGDWALYGEEQAALEEILRRLVGTMPVPAEDAAPAATPEA